VDATPHIVPEATIDERGKRKVTTRKVSRRANNFSTKEDEMICAAYLNVSKDPIIGIGQPSARYWKRIHDYFHTHKTFELDRTQVAIQHRWGIIQKETSRFCGFKSMIDRRNESGKTEDDRVTNLMNCIVTSRHYSIFELPYLFTTCPPHCRFEMLSRHLRTQSDIRFRCTTAGSF